MDRFLITHWFNGKEEISYLKSRLHILLSKQNKNPNQKIVTFKKTKTRLVDWILLVLSVCNLAQVYPG